MQSLDQNINCPQYSKINLEVWPFKIFWSNRYSVQWFCNVLIHYLFLRETKHCRAIGRNKVKTKRSQMAFLSQVLVKSNLTWFKKKTVAKKRPLKCINIWIYCSFNSLFFSHMIVHHKLYAEPVYYFISLVKGSYTSWPKTLTICLYIWNCILF